MRTVPPLCRDLGGRRSAGFPGRGCRIEASATQCRQASGDTRLRITFGGKVLDRLGLPAANPAEGWNAVRCPDSE
jgi:hypothetical protein